MFFMELFGKMELNTYLCRAKKERDGLRHQRYITQTGYRTLPEFAKKETLRIIPQQFQARQHDTVQLTYPSLVPANSPVNGWSLFADGNSSSFASFRIISLSLSSGKWRFLANFKSFLYCPVIMIVLIRKQL